MAKKMTPTIISKFIKAYVRKGKNLLIEGGKKFQEALAAVSLDRDSVENMVKDIKKELSETADRAESSSLKFIFPYLPKELKLQIIGLLSVEDRSRLAAMSAEMDALVKYYQAHAKDVQRLKSEKVHTMGEMNALLKSLGFTPVTNYPPEARVIGIENRHTKTVDFHLESGSYRKVVIVKVPKDLLYYPK
jgi:hypothetical protein